MVIRPAEFGDIPAVLRIYNAGIASGLTTFEWEMRRESDIERWFSDRYPFFVGVEEGEVLGFAVTGSYSPRPCYAGVADFSVYVDGRARGKGVGSAVLVAVMDRAREVGFHKFVGRVFSDNQPSLRLLGKLGFREVGTHHRHGQVRGAWKDVIVVECLL
ncbi:MAG: arsinothricin resistance N-acetyltransferase ArsN1 family A [Bryobacteraceae bacterium]|nr:arsinothricin resistance N-acetyltransferase ArsN1 family A [Bryobacteraceae bacterium]